jgi:hypothetical protein
MGFLSVLPFVLAVSAADTDETCAGEVPYHEDHFVKILCAENFERRVTDSGNNVFVFFWKSPDQSCMPCSQHHTEYLQFARMMRGVDNLVVAKMDLTNTKTEDLPQVVQDELSKHPHLPVLLLFSHEDKGITPFPYHKGLTAGKQHKEFLPDMAKFLHKQVGADDSAWKVFTNHVHPIDQTFIPDMFEVHSQERSWEIFIHEKWQQKSLCPVMSAEETCKSEVLHEKDFPGAEMTLDASMNFMNQLEPEMAVDVFWCTLEGTLEKLKTIEKGENWEYKSRKGNHFLVYTSEETPRLMAKPGLSISTRHRGWTDGEAVKVEIQTCVTEQDHFDPKPKKITSVEEPKPKSAQAVEEPMSIAQPKTKHPNRRKIKFSKHKGGG